MSDNQRLFINENTQKEVNMGLAIKVGTYADLLKEDPSQAEWLGDTFAALNEVLAENGIELHHEPKILTKLKNRAQCDSFPYSFIHYLRRFYAQVETDPNWVPAPVKEDEDPTDDPAIEEVSSMLESHLLCHSDCDGFYLPIKFDEIIFDDEDRIPGGALGSSYKLLEELIFIAPKLNIILKDGQLSDSEADKINELADNEGNFHREYCVWIALYEAASESIENKTAIYFC